MNVKASSQIEAEPASAPKAIVRREILRWSTLTPNAKISSEVAAVGNAVGVKLSIGVPITSLLPGGERLLF